MARFEFALSEMKEKTPNPSGRSFACLPSAIIVRSEGENGLPREGPSTLAALGYRWAAFERASGGTSSISPAQLGPVEEVVSGSGSLGRADNAEDRPVMSFRRDARLQKVGANFNQSRLMAFGHHAPQAHRPC
jgi:hypothetical protein